MVRAILYPMNRSVPRAVRVQLAHLFGAASSEASAESRGPGQWKRLLQKVLDELYRYVEVNVETDELHWFMICTAFAASSESLKEEDFWPGFSEGLIRLSFLLVGDYPDHRRRTTGKRKAEHYRLDRLRRMHYVQDQDQRLKVLLAAQNAGHPELSIDPRKALSEFRALHGFRASYREFMKWYKKAYPRDYSAVF